MTRIGGARRDALWLAKAGKAVRRHNTMLVNPTESAHAVFAEVLWGHGAQESKSPSRWKLTVKKRKKNVIIDLATPLGPDAFQKGGQAGFRGTHPTQDHSHSPPRKPRNDPRG